MRQKGGFLLTKAGVAYFSSRNIGFPQKHIMSTDGFHERAAQFIVENSTIELISYSSLYGFIYKATLNDGIPTIFSQFYPTPACLSPKNTSNESCYRPVREFIIKFSFLTPDASGEIGYNFSDINKRTNIISDFTNECIVQNNVYSSNFMAGAPMVPPVVTPTPIILDFGNEIINRFNVGEPFQNSIDMLAGLGVNQFGLMIMGLASGFTTLHNYVNDDGIPNEQKINVINMARYFIWKFSNTFGLVHRDIHMGNIMVNMNDDFVFKMDAEWINGNFYLIDFGRVREMAQYEVAAMSENTYTDFLTFVQNECSPGGVIYPSYQWLTEDYGQNENEVNEIMAQIHAAFQNAGEYRSNFFTNEGINPFGTIAEVHSQLNGIRLSRSNYTNLGLTPPNNAMNWNASVAGRRRKTRRVQNRRKVSSMRRRRTLKK